MEMTPRINPYRNMPTMQQARQKLGLALEDLEAMTGIKKSRLHTYEKETRIPPKKAIIEIEKVIGPTTLSLRVVAMTLRREFPRLQPIFVESFAIMICTVMPIQEPIPSCNKP